MGYILTSAERDAVDHAAIDAGIPSLTLMEAAGKAVSEYIIEHYPNKVMLILCGPGNNGGDGFVAARYLRDHGFDIILACDAETFPHDANHNRLHYNGQIYGINEALEKPYDVVVDALFGTGLSRPLEGKYLSLAEQVNAQHLPVIAVDIPSGISSDTGGVLGDAIKATATICFIAKTRGHLLHPGSDFSGEIYVDDIGVSSEIIRNIAPNLQENLPELFAAKLPKKLPDEHKYHHGHLLVIGGGLAHRGAAMLAAIAGLRMGAGLVTVACPEKAHKAYASKALSLITKAYSSPKDLEPLLHDPRITAILIGPGIGVSDATRKMVEMILNTKRSVLLDADALSSFAKEKEVFYALTKKNGQAVLTPHMGEFVRIFAVDESESKVSHTLNAAKQSGAVTLLKGGDTVICDPTGKGVINSNALPNLATAGSGDVLSGMIAGLLAQNVAPFDAAQMGCYFHGAASHTVLEGLIAEDLINAIPDILQDFRKTFAD